MGFFERIDEMGIVEQTIQKVESLEESEARALLRRFKAIRQELRDRLDVLPYGTFTAQQQRGALIQIEAAIEAINQSLKMGMSESAEKVAIHGSDDLILEIQTFSKEFTGAVVPLDINSALIGLETKNFLINRYESSIDAYSEGLRSQLTQNLTDLSIQQLPFDTVIRKLSQFFIGEEWRLRRIARTELHNVYNMGKMTGMQEAKESTLPSLKKTLVHPMDERTAEDSKKLARLNPIVDINKPFVFVWKGKKREFMAPPDRPNDRSILVPYMPEWEQ